MPTAKTQIHRHDISYENVQRDGQTFIRPLCSCGGLQSPAFWAREKAEEKAHDHKSSIKVGRREKK